jgi:hypothetical protein
MTDAQIIAVRKAQVGRYGTVDPTKPYADSVAFGRAVAAARDAAWVERVTVLREALQKARPFIKAWPQCRDSKTPEIEGSGLLQAVDAALENTK